MYCSVLNFITHLSEHYLLLSDPPSGEWYNIAFIISVKGIRSKPEEEMQKR